MKRDRRAPGTRAQPADEALRLLGGALGVEGDEPFQDLLVGERDRPAVRVAHGGVQLAVELPQHADQPLLVDRLVFGGQRLAGPQLLQHVVHVGQGQLGVLGLLAIAVRVQLLGQVADARPLRVGRGGKGDFLRAGWSALDRIVADAEMASGGQRQVTWTWLGEHAQEVGVVQPMRPTFALADRSVKERENPMFGSLHSCDEALNVSEGRTEDGSRNAKIHHFSRTESMRLF